MLYPGLPCSHLCFRRDLEHLIPELVRGMPGYIWVNIGSIRSMRKVKPWWNVPHQNVWPSLWVSTAERFHLFCCQIHQILSCFVFVYWLVSLTLNEVKFIHGVLSSYGFSVYSDSTECDYKFVSKLLKHVLDVF